MILLQSLYIIFMVRGLKNALFLDFFPLWGNIYPYINGGAMMAQAIKPKCTDWVQFHFHGKSLCEIWHAFHLRMYFQNRSAKKRKKPSNNPQLFGNFAG